jgi:hypothetical protein
MDYLAEQLRRYLIKAVTNETLPIPSAKPLDHIEEGLAKRLHITDEIYDSELFFNEKVISDFILEYKHNRDILIWKRIVEEAMPLIDTTIRDHNFHQFEEVDALRAECAVKLSKVLLNHDPAQGRCFTHFSVSFKNFLISYVQKVKNKAELETGGESDVLERVEGKTYVRKDVIENFKTRLNEAVCGFLVPNQMDALMYLVNFFLVEGFGTSKSKLCYTLVSAFNLTPDRGYVLYDFALIMMRSTLYEYYLPHHTDVDILRLSRRWSILPEIAQVTGIETFTKLADLFGGVTVTFPTPKDIARLRTERNILDRAEYDASYRALHALGTSSGGDEGSKL